MNLYKPIVGGLSYFYDRFFCFVAVGYTFCIWCFFMYHALDSSLRYFVRHDLFGT
jgi:hypothetical protein